MRMSKNLYFYYNVLLCSAGIIALPFFLCRLGRYKKSLKQKLGFFDKDYFPAKKKCRIWMHAVSVGEVAGITPVVTELKKEFPGAEVFVSTGTVSGQAAARRELTGKADGFFYYPLDFPFAVRRTVDKVLPDIFIAAESEIWPGLLWRLKKNRVKLFLINGRMSGRSFRLFHAARFFWSRAISLFDFIAMASERDCRWMLRLGAPEKRIAVLGNSKHDGLKEKVKEEYEDEMRALLSVKTHEQVFIPASLHPAEFRIIARACAEMRAAFPHLTFIAVPRHPRRAARLVRAFREYGLECYLRSSANAGLKRQGEPVIIVDAIGELFKIYSLGNVAFCGGSLVPLGGQNILEPAAWGKPVLYGPWMENFEGEKELLESAGAGFTVKSGAEISETAGRLIANPAQAAGAGRRGMEAVLSKKAVSEEISRLVKNVSGL